MTDCDSDMLMFYNVFFCSCLHPGEGSGANAAYTQYESQLRDFNYALRGVKKSKQPLDTT